LEDPVWSAYTSVEKQKKGKRWLVTPAHSNESKKVKNFPKGAALFRVQKKNPKDSKLNRLNEKG